jgi:hypothetical protein
VNFPHFFRKKQKNAPKWRNLAQSGHTVFEHAQANGKKKTFFSSTDRLRCNSQGKDRPCCGPISISPEKKNGIKVPFDNLFKCQKRNVSKCTPRDATLIAGLVLFPIKNAALEVRCF